MACECHDKMGNDFYFLPLGKCLREDGVCTLPDSQIEIHGARHNIDLKIGASSLGSAQAVKYASSAAERWDSCPGKARK